MCTGTTAVMLLVVSACGADGERTDTSRSVPPPTTAPAPVSTPTLTPTPTPDESPSPDAVLGLVCGDPGVTEFAVQTIEVAPSGMPDYSRLWPLKLTCDQGYDDQGILEVTSVITPLQSAVVAQARKVGYASAEDLDENVLYGIYEACGSNAPDDVLLTMDDYSESQVDELQLWMLLCPSHPHSKTWKSKIKASAKAWEAEANGTRVFDGTYKVPSQMKRGTFVVKDVENCYWETRDASGEIIDNGFVIAAPRVVARVGKSAVVFTAKGCGRWDRQ